MNAEQVVNEITRRAWRLNVAVMLSEDSFLHHSDGAQCSGYFDSEADTPTLKVATGIKESDWLGILLHEYSHACQWSEQAKCWVEQERTPGMWDWIAGKPLKNAAHVVDLTKELEADCERRTVRLIKELQAPIDLAEYCRQSNAYIHFHNVIKQKRKWVKQAGILRKPEVTKHFNDTIDSDYQKTPKAMFDVLVRHAI
jgi:hypothetical protein